MRSQNMETIADVQQVPRTGNNAITRKLELLASLRDRDWKPTEQHDLIEFSDRLMSSVDMDLEERFFNAILGRLYFADLSDRYESIPKAHEDTFRWVFESKSQQRNSDEWDSFADWLSGTDGKNIF